MEETRAAGKFVWYDLMTSDPEQAKAFYSKVIGWGTSVWEGPEPYTMWTSEAGPIGGVMAQPPGVNAPPHWMGYVGVADVDRTTQQAASLGGKTLLPPTDIPSVGRFAVLADPQGASFAVFTPKDPADQGPDLSDRPGNFSWHELMTTDYVSALKFYEAIFGWKKRAEHDMGPMGIYCIFGSDTAEMGGMFNKTPDMPIPPNWMQYIRVDSVARVAPLVKANGGTVMHGPHEVPGGDWIAQCLDPQGAAFALHAKNS